MGFVLVKKSASLKQQFEDWARPVNEHLDEMGQRHVQRRRQVVANFKNKPDFAYKVKKQKTRLEMTVFIRNSSAAVGGGRSQLNIGGLWKILDQTGVKPRIITIKRSRYLAFRERYVPKTRRGGRFGGAGVSTGKMVFRKVVKNPGFKPRKFTKKINRDVEREFADFP